VACTAQSSRKFVARRMSSMRHKLLSSPVIQRTVVVIRFAQVHGSM